MEDEDDIRIDAGTSRSRSIRNSNPPLIGAQLFPSGREIIMYISTLISRIDQNDPKPRLTRTFDWFADWNGPSLIARIQNGEEDRFCQHMLKCNVPIKQIDFPRNDTHLVQHFFTVVYPKIHTTLAEVFYNHPKWSSRPNPNSDQEITHIANAIREVANVNTGLKVLSFEYNEIGVDGAVALAQLFAPRCNTTTIPVNSTPAPPTESGTVATNVVGAVPGIEEFNLAHNKIRDEGCIALAHAIGHKESQLRVLDLSYNQIGDEGAIAIADTVLRNNKHLETLDLSHNRIELAGLQAIAAALPYSTLRSLSLQMEILADKPPVYLKIVNDAFACALQRSTKMDELYVFSGDEQQRQIFTSTCDENKRIKSNYYALLGTSNHRGLVDVPMICWPDALAKISTKPHFLFNILREHSSWYEYGEVFRIFASEAKQEARAKRQERNRFLENYYLLKKTGIIVQEGPRKLSIRRSMSVNDYDRTVFLNLCRTLHKTVRIEEFRILDNIKAFMSEYSDPFEEEERNLSSFETRISQLNACTPPECVGSAGMELLVTIWKKLFRQIAGNILEGDESVEALEHFEMLSIVFELFIQVSNNFNSLAKPVEPSGSRMAPATESHTMGGNCNTANQTNYAKVEDEDMEYIYSSSDEDDNNTEDGMSESENYCN